MKSLKQCLEIFECISELKKLKDVMEEKKKRSCSVRKINRDRRTHGYFIATFLKIKMHDPDQFFIHTRMTMDVFECLLTCLKSYMEKHSIREPVSPECRLSLTLLHLSQGSTIQSLAWMYKLGKEIVRRIVLDTCFIICIKLGSIYVAEPNLNEMEKISEDFWNLWNLPNCIGAIDFKHIAIQCPPLSGSNYFNYKKYHSIVLMAVADAQYTFTYVDIGAYGSQSDGGIFQASKFGQRFFSNDLAIPHAKDLPGTNIKVPHFLVGDAAFPLTRNLMRPYPGQLLPPDREIFNKRLSRARRIIENAFGILTARWRILLTTINMIPSNAETVVAACVTLHNYLILNKEAQSSYIPRSYVDWEDSNIVHPGSWRDEANSLNSILPSQRTHNYTRFAKRIRDDLKDFVNANPI